MKREHEEACIYEALSHVETPEYDIGAAVRRQRAEGNTAALTRRHLPRAALVAACLVLALAVGAAAVGLSGNWYRFFGMVPENAVTTVGVSQTSGDYTLTIEDAMADNNGVVLLFALTRADGGEVDPEASLQAGNRPETFMVDGERFGGGGFNDSQLSEDGKTLYLWYEMRDNSVQGDDGPLGKNLTFQADCVAKRIFHMGEGIPTSLAPLAELEISEVSCGGVHDADYDAKLNAALAPQEIHIPLPLDEQFPAYGIRGAAVTDNGLAIAIGGRNSVNGDLSCTGIWPDELIDTRDGTAYGGRSGHRVELADGTHAMLWSFYDCPLTVEDLPYLELTVDYEVDQILSEEPFSLKFTVDSGAAEVIPVDRDVEVTGLTLHVTELRLSALGLTLNFTDDTSFDLYETGGAPVLELTDGTSIQTTWTGGNERPDGTCAVSFSTAGLEPGERAFFDTDQIASVRFGDLEVPMG